MACSSHSSTTGPCYSLCQECPFLVIWPTSVCPSKFSLRIISIWGPSLKGPVWARSLCLSAHSTCQMKVNLQPPSWEPTMLCLNSQTMSHVWHSFWYMWSSAMAWRISWMNEWMIERMLNNERVIMGFLPSFSVIVREIKNWARYHFSSIWLFWEFFLALDLQR